MIGFVFIDAIERLITTQFWDAERQDVTVTFVEPRRPARRHALARLPGVIAVEPQRIVAVRIRSGHRERYLAITGVRRTPRFAGSSIADGRAIRLPPSGVVLSQMLADVLGVSAGDTVTLEVLEGARPVAQVAVDGPRRRHPRLSAYMDMAALHALMREGDVSSGALLLVDAAQRAAAVASAEGSCRPSRAPASSAPCFAASARRWPRT